MNSVLIQLLINVVLPLIVSYFTAKKKLSSVVQNLQDKHDENSEKIKNLQKDLEIVKGPVMGSTDDLSDASLSPRRVYSDKN